MRGHIQLHGLDRVQGRVGKKLCSTSPPCLGPTSPNRASRANRRSPDARPAGGRSEASDGSRRVPEVPRTTRSVPTGRPSSPIGRYTSEAVPQAAQHRAASRGTADPRVSRHRAQWPITARHRNKKRDLRHRQNGRLDRSRTHQRQLTFSARRVTH